jgi:hypothetical protein
MLSASAEDRPTFQDLPMSQWGPTKEHAMLILQETRPPAERLLQDEEGWHPMVDTQGKAYYASGVSSIEANTTALHLNLLLVRTMLPTLDHDLQTP